MIAKTWKQSLTCTQCIIFYQTCPIFKQTLELISREFFGGRLDRDEPNSSHSASCWKEHVCQHLSQILKSSKTGNYTQKCLSWWQNVTIKLTNQWLSWLPSSHQTGSPLALGQSEGHTRSPRPSRERPADPPWRRPWRQPLHLLGTSRRHRNPLRNPLGPKGKRGKPPFHGDMMRIMMDNDG